MRAPSIKPILLQASPLASMPDAPAIRTDVLVTLGKFEEWISGSLANAG